MNDPTVRRESLVDAAVLAATTAAWTAVPDFVTTPALRRLVRVGLVAAGGAVGQLYTSSVDRRLVAMASDLDDDLQADGGPATATDQDGVGNRPVALETLFTEKVPPRYRGLVLTGAVLATVGMTTTSLRLQQRLDDAVAGRLALRGAPLPYTLTGILWGVCAMGARSLTDTIPSACR